MKELRSVLISLFHTQPTAAAFQLLSNNNNTDRSCRRQRSRGSLWAVSTCLRVITGGLLCVRVKNSRPPLAYECRCSEPIKWG
jgi:hypothetical protein